MSKLNSVTEEDGYWVVDKFGNNRVNYDVLILENDIPFLPELIKRYKSIDAAILMYRMFCLIDSNKAVIRKDGFYWYSASYEDLRDQFPWITLNNIKIAMKLLVKIKVLVSESVKNTQGKTKWYRMFYPSDLESLHPIFKKEKPSSNNVINFILKR